MISGDGSLSPVALAAGLVRLLDVEAVEDGLFRGARKPGGVGRVYGGQVIGQALMAASRTAPAGRLAHSLHAYFLRPGDEDYPIDFRVEADFDGGTFSNRRVVALQQGKAIFNLIASFQVQEEGLHHQREMPPVPPPEEVPTRQEYAELHADRLDPRLIKILTRPTPIEVRAVDDPPFCRPAPRAPTTAIWFRCVAPLPDDQVLHRAVLAHASDFALLATALLPHGVSWITHPVQIASIDHALWFHAPVKADEWLLYATESPWSGHGRGLATGSIFTRDGRLIASVAQEGLMRMRG